jgi:hypothetical protein
MRIAIFAPVLYPFHVDMVKVLHDKIEAKIFTCVFYGSYPFEELLNIDLSKC